MLSSETYLKLGIDQKPKIIFLKFAIKIYLLYYICEICLIHDAFVVFSKHN